MLGENTTLTPTWILYADGVRLPPLHEGELLSITVHNRLSDFSRASLLFENQGLVKDGTLKLDSELSLLMGYKDDLVEVFAGKVIGLPIHCSSWGGKRLEVEAYTRFTDMNRARRELVYERKTPAAICRTIAGRWGLQAAIDDFGTERLFSAQNDETDYGHLARFCYYYGKDMYIHDKKL